MIPERLQEITDMATGVKDGYWLIPSTVRELIDEINRLKTLCKDKDEKFLRNILAVLNRDGGHYQQEHGVEDAVKTGLSYHYSKVARVDELEYLTKTLFNRIKHGDQKHQNWLKKKLEDHFKG